MARMTKVKILCLVAAFAVVLQVSFAAPVAEGHEANEVVDEILMRLKQLRQQSEGKGRTGVEVFCVWCWVVF